MRFRKAFGAIRKKKTIRALISYAVSAGKQRTKSGQTSESRKQDHFAQVNRSVWDTIDKAVGREKMIACKQLINWRENR